MFLSKRYGTVVFHCISGLDPYHRITDPSPDPSLFSVAFKMPTNIFFSMCFFLITYRTVVTFTSVLKNNKSLRSHKNLEINFCHKYFCFFVDGRFWSRIWSRSLKNNYRSGSWRPKDPDDCNQYCVFGPPGSFPHQAQIERKTLIPTVLRLYDFLSLKNDLNVPVFLIQIRIRIRMFLGLPEQHQSR